MINSIQHFGEFGIKKLEKAEKNFFKSYCSHVGL